MTAENPAFGPIDDHSIPPLDQHLKSLTIKKTRIGKVYDFLIGELIQHWTGGAPIGLGTCRQQGADIIQILVATEAYHELPNRKRLVELIEKVMPKEGAK